ncbi:hypothetical protein F5Y11DRAFT_332418 [Daldinia sp. FL1419]|nr:hypothetical protein F5Y11DRAFT_332418 [Daldinia sp. FL1419]
MTIKATTGGNPRSNDDGESRPGNRSQKYDDEFISMWDNVSISNQENAHDDDLDDGYDYSSDSDDSNPDDDDNEKSQGWIHNQLKTLSDGIKGLTTKRVIRFVEKYLKGTKLIFVVGQTGTGKSTILQELTGLKPEVGHTLESGTRKYEILPAFVGGQQYLFVDTAGFGAADMDDMANYYDIMNCLKVLGPFVTVAGLMFVYGKMPTRLRKEDLRTIQWVECFCGPKFFRNIIFITNSWDSWSKKAFEKAWNDVPKLLKVEDVKRILNPPGHYKEGSVYHHGFPGGDGSLDDYDNLLNPEDHHLERGAELQQLVHKRYSRATGIKLQVLREIESGTPINETEAAKVLKADTPSTSIRIQKGYALVTTNPTNPQASNPTNERSELSNPSSSPAAQALVLRETQLSLQKHPTPTRQLVEEREAPKRLSYYDPWQGASMWAKAAWWIAKYFRRLFGRGSQDQGEKA